MIYKEESYAIVGACMAVYKDKGCGFLEPVYHECLAIEFEFRGIPFLSKPPQTLQYRGLYTRSNVFSGFPLLRKDHSGNQGLVRVG